MKLYDELAPWWTLFSHPSHYAEEAADYLRLFGEGVHEVLELGSGGGNNASHMKRKLQLTLVEPSEGTSTACFRPPPGCGCSTRRVSMPPSTSGAFPTASFPSSAPPGADAIRMAFGAKQVPPAPMVRA